MQLSTQQQAIVQSVAANDKNVIVIARAGTGKTTTILAACGVAQGRVAFFAFNKAIAQELSNKAPPGVEVKTLHSLGFAILRGHFRKLNVDADKTFYFIRKYLGDEEGNISKEDFELVASIKKLVSIAKNCMVLDASDEVLDELALTYNTQANGDTEKVYEIVRRILKAGIPSLQQQFINIDFDDMIYLPVVLGLRNVPQFDWTFVDEAQDLNLAQMELVDMVSRQGRVCLVGDPCQAIYAFRGADSEAMNTFKARMEATGRETATLPLNKTWRCPKAVVELARTIVPDYEALPEAPQGSVTEAKELEPKPGDMVLCRMNAPLVSPVYRLLRAGIPAKIQGRDIGQGLKTLINKLKATSIDNLVDKLAAYEAKERASINGRYRSKPSKPESALGALQDKVETIRFIAYENNSVQELLSAIDKLFTDVTSSNSIVLLSTIHKAKGLEAPKVWIIKTKAIDGGQEDNLRYVSYTRAKNELVFVAEDERQG